MMATLLILMDATPLVKLKMVGLDQEIPLYVLQFEETATEFQERHEMTGIILTTKVAYQTALEK